MLYILNIIQKVYFICAYSNLPCLFEWILKYFGNTFASSEVVLIT